MSVVCRHGQGAVIEKLRDGADLIIVLLKVAQADDLLRDHETLADVLAANTEADFTNYARKTVANASTTVTYDTVTNKWEAGAGSQTWASAGGATNNTLAKAIVCEDTGADATRRPLVALDFTATTTGSPLAANFTPFYRST